MMTNMNSKLGTDLDKAYIAGMIEHHKGAIEMAKKILPSTKLNEVKLLANNIVTNQSQEVELLNGWLKFKFAQSPLGNSNSRPSDTCPDGQSQRVMPGMCMEDPELKPHNDSH